MITHAVKEDAERVIECIRAELEATNFNFNGISLKVTASFGLVGFAGTRAPDFNQLVASADLALYSAKHLGRNRIEVGEARTM